MKRENKIKSTVNDPNTKYSKSLETIISLLWEYVVKRIAMIEDRLLLGFKEDIITIENGLQNS